MLILHIYHVTPHISYTLLLHHSVSLQHTHIAWLYSTVVLYIRDHGDLSFPSQKNSPKNRLHNSILAVLVRYNQAQKCLQYDPKGFQ